MSARLRLAPALLVTLLGVALALHMSPSGAGSTVNPAPTSPVSAVGGVAIPVADMDRSVAFYSTVLFFDTVSDVQTSGPSIDRLLGVTGARVRVVTMRLGAERIELVEYLGRNGRPVPDDAQSNDRSFQHIAIVVNDMDQAYLWLRRHRVEQTSPEPQRLPDWNPKPAASARSPSRTRTATRSRFSSFQPGRATPAGSGRAIASSSGSITRRSS